MILARKLQDERAEASNVVGFLKRRTCIYQDLPTNNEAERGCNGQHCRSSFYVVSESG
jgi:hypothetical protein